MNHYRFERMLCAIVTMLVFAGCSADAQGPATGNDPQSDSRLDPEARAELAQLGIDRYRGAAVISGEAPSKDGAAIRVSFDPQSGPICLRGDGYAAFYLDRGADRTLIVLDGGGACWTGLCSAKTTPDDEITTRGPASADPDSEFKTWNIVFAPYCDGSVFWGDNEVQEADGSMRYQRGRQNLAAALDLAEQHFGTSRQVLLFGFSAGGYGTILGTASVRLRFPNADLFVMNDSGPGVQNPANAAAIEQRLSDWKYGELIPSSCVECAGGRGQLSAMQAWMLGHDPTLRIALLSFYEDPVIGGTFNALDGPSYKALLMRETDTIHAAFPDRFQRYMLPGAEHVVSTQWTTQTADGVRVSDWILAMTKDDSAAWTDLLATGP